MSPGTILFLLYHGIKLFALCSAQFSALPQRLGFIPLQKQQIGLCYTTLTCPEMIHVCFYPTVY